MAKEIIKHVTDNDNLLFIGEKDDEEYYQKLDEKWWWSFMWLRPNTQEELREMARDTDIEDYCTIPDFLMNYIDREAFAEDMGNERQERHDVQAERIQDITGDILYLWFGSGQDMYGYYKSNNIVTYEDYCNHFDVIGLTEKRFYELQKEYAQKSK